MSFARAAWRTFAMGLAVALGCTQGQRTPDTELPATKVPQLFQTSDGCMACHNSLTTPAGEDVSIGTAWRATMMANSARDPYWQASVRSESMDHPTRAAEIEDECSKCHMPMMRLQARHEGRRGEVFSHLPIDSDADGATGLAADGVSCTTCHQILDTQLGRPESFNGNFAVDAIAPQGRRPVFGPFDVDEGRRGVMHSSSEYVPTRGDHIRSSEICATCHTLYTEAHDASGRVVGRLPEQVPYLEWKNSDYAEKSSCQGCHMPPVADAIPISSVLGTAREGMGRHDFRGGNFFMLQMLNRYRTELGVTAQPQELNAAVQKTVAHLREQTARLTIEQARIVNGRLEASIVVRNLSGHKLPTAYPSRRTWLHVTVRDRTGKTVFESGAIAPDGSIDGNDNDADATAFEPHHRVVTQPGQVQIYESVMADASGNITTGLLSAVRYVKDNRLLPEGFSKATADADVAVRGDALADPDFVGGRDQVTYSIDVGSDPGPYDLRVEMRFQPISFRWAQNLQRHGKAGEIARFTSYYNAMARASSTVLTETSATVR